MLVTPDKVELFFTNCAERNKRKIWIVYNSVGTNSDAYSCLNQATSCIEKIIGGDDLVVVIAKGGFINIRLTGNDQGIGYNILNGYLFETW